MATKLHPETEKILKEMGWERSPEDSRFKGQWCTRREGKIISIDDDPRLREEFMMKIVKEAEALAFSSGSSKGL